MREIIEKTLLRYGDKSVVPIGNLQQRIALALGGTQGAGKIGTIASHMIEEGLLFAAYNLCFSFLTFF